MNTLPHTPAQARRLLVHPGSIAMAVLMLALAPAAARADPPAVVATCTGIKDAYPILGTRCAKSYARINHAPANEAQRLATFVARKDVLQIFQTALVCNGIYKATDAVQEMFKNGEEGHLMALDNLHDAMEAARDREIPAAYTREDLKKEKITKLLCK